MKKKIINFVLFIAAIVAIPELYIHIKEYMSQHGGSVMMSLMNRHVENNENRTIFVCVSDTSQHLNGISITPIFDNSSEYPVNGFDLRYSVEVADGAAPVTNDFFSYIEMGGNEYQYKYKENVLPQYSPTYEPFRLSAFPLKNSRYIIKSKATYSGAPYPYNYTVFLWLRIVPKYTNQTIENWRLACKQAIYETKASPDTYDAFYCCENQVFNEFGKDFGSINNFNYQNSDTKEIKKNEEKKIDNNKNREKIVVNNNKPSLQDKGNNDVKTANKPNTSIKTIDNKNNTIKFLSFDAKPKGLGFELDIKANQVLKSNTTYYAVYHYFNKTRKNYYGVVSFVGKNSNVVKVYVNEHNNEKAEIDYVTAPQNDNSLINNIIFEKESSGRYKLHTNSDSSFVLVYDVNNTNKTAIILNKDENYYINDIDDKSKVNFDQTLKYEQMPKPPIPWWHHVISVFILIFCAFALLGGIIGIQESSSLSEKILNVFITLVILGMSAFIFYYYVIKGDNIVMFIYQIIS